MSTIGRRPRFYVDAVTQGRRTYVAVDAVTQGRRTYVAVDDLQAYLEALAQAAPEWARMLRTIRAELEIGIREALP